jgi:hypothetical protein
MLFYRFVHTECFIKTRPISSTYISNATLDVILNEVSHVRESFRFRGKAVILLSAADWPYIHKLNKTNTLKSVRP